MQEYLKDKLGPWDVYWLDEESGSLALNVKNCRFELRYEKVTEREPWTVYLADDQGAIKLNTFKASTLQDVSARAGQIVIRYLLDCLSEVTLAEFWYVKLS